MSKKKRRQLPRRKPSRRATRHSRYEALVEKYRPGTPKEVAVDPSGTEDEWQARMMHAWMNGRDIPVEDLSVLFNRDKATIRRWLEMTG